MKHLRVIICAIAFFSPTLAQAQPVPASFADIAEKLSPAVVNISTTQHIKQGGVQMFGFPPELQGHPGLEQFQDFFEQFNRMQGGQPVEREVTSLGSGVVIDAAGYIITNFHVINKAEEITVRFSDDTQLKAKIIGRDSKTDLALLKVEPEKPLAFVTFGDSDQMRVGDWVIAIGNPFGLGGTVTAGIISARQRSINAGPFDDFIQTDAAINQGNSGGPLFNMNGEVIGINSAIFSPTGGNIGIGFSIPSNLARPIIEQLKQFGRTHRGWLGVKIQDVTDEVADSIGLAKGNGALVAEVTEGSPAAKAGIKSGDIITHYDGQEITKMRALPRLVADTKAGSKVPVTIWRNGKSNSVTVTIDELDETTQADGNTGDDLKSDVAPSNGTTVLGMKLSNITEAIRQQLGIDAKSGVVVVELESGSDAARRGIRPGDLISEVNNQKAADTKQFKRLIEDAKKAGRSYALLRITRKDETAFVTVPLK